MQAFLLMLRTNHSSYSFKEGVQMKITTRLFVFALAIALVAIGTAGIASSVASHNVAKRQSVKGCLAQIPPRMPNGVPVHGHYVWVQKEHGGGVCVYTPPGFLNGNAPKWSVPEQVSDEARACTSQTPVVVNGVPEDGHYLWDAAEKTCLYMPPGDPPAPLP